MPEPAEAPPRIGEANGGCADAAQGPDAIRVLYVSHTGAWGGGGEYSLRQLMRVARMDGWVPMLACPPGELSREISKVSSATYQARLPSLRRTKNPITGAALVCQWAVGVVALIRALRHSGAPLVHANSGVAALSAFPAALVLRKGLIWHQHDVVPNRRINRLVLRPLASRCRAVVATSHTVARSLQEIGIAPRKVRVIHPRLDAGLLAEPGGDGVGLRALGLPDDVPVISIVGRLVPRKQQDVFLRSLALLARRGYRFSGVVAGGTPPDPGASEEYATYLRQLHKFADEPELKGLVRFLGHVDRIDTVYAASDVVVMPSAYEPFGRVVIEACASGVPVVAARAGGPLEVIEDGVTGLLAEPGDPESFANAIGRLLDDPALRTSMGRRAAADITERFGEHGLREQVRSLYSGALTDVAG